MTYGLEKGLRDAASPEFDMPDPNLSQRRAAQPTWNTWVSASAGSGKTKVLTDRVLALLLTGTRPERLLCITFTKAAAAEMANRLTKRLGEWTRSSDAELDADITSILGTEPDEEMRRAARRLFAAVLDAPGGVQIKTIHSFCQSVLGRFPLETNTTPRFEVMDERTSAELMQAARDTVLAQANDEATGQGSERSRALRHAVGVISRRLQEDRFDKLLVELSRERSRLRRLLGVDASQLGAVMTRLYEALNAEPGLDEEAVRKAACAEEVFDRDDLINIVEALRTYGNQKTDADKAAGIAAWLAGDAEDRVRLYEAYKLVFLTADGKPREKLMTKAVFEKDPAALAAMEREADRLLAVEATLKRQITAECSAALLTLGSEMLKTYEVGKTARSLLDYDDLILRTRDLLDPARKSVSWVMYKLDGGLEHILVDEAQDTSLEQWEIISGLAEDFFSGDGVTERTRTLFVVGDLKQSIYSFQRADPMKFLEMRADFKTRIQNVNQNFQSVPMSVSFRSTRAVLSAVDAVFANPTAKDGLAGADETVAHFAHRASAPGLVELWPLVPAAAKEDAEPWSLPIAVEAETPADRRLAEGLARRIAGWIDREYLPSKQRMVRAGDILILVRSRNRLVNMLIRALKGEGVAVAGVDRMVLSRQLAVQDLVALFQFLLLPTDDLTLASVLKGPLIGLSEEDLFDLAWDRGKLSLWERLQIVSAKESRFAAVADWLSALLAAVDYDPPFELLSRVLNNPCPAPVPEGETPPLSGRRAVLARLGIEAEDPIDEFLNLALTYDQRRTPSLQGFLHWFAAGEEAIKRDLEAEARDELRVMTVHGSKGLQAPIVILPDTMTTVSSRGGADPKLFWIDGQAGDAIPAWPPAAAFVDGPCADEREVLKTRAAQEDRRLLYVAMTRAEDRLYICGAAGQKKVNGETWYSLVEAGLSGHPDRVEADFSEGEGWSGPMLRLTYGVHEAPIDHSSDLPSVPPSTSEPQALPDWLFAEPAAEPSPPRPIVPSRPDIDDPPARSPLSGDQDRIYRRGTLIHSLLQFLPELPIEERESAALRYLIRPVSGVEENAARRIYQEVARVMEDPQFAPIFGPNSQAEVPLTGLLGEGENAQVVSGQLDRLVVTDESVLVIDYKTLRPAPEIPSQIPAAYIRQLATYRGLLQQIFPDKTVRCALLWTDIPRLMVLDDRLLKL